MNDKQSWIEQRQKTIGSSDDPIIALGGTAWKSVYTLWDEKSGLLEPSQEENKAMEYGVLLEPYVASLYERETSRKLRDLGRYITQKNSVYEFAHSTVGNRRAIEC